MRKIYYLLLLFFSFSVLSAQEKLSKEEKARREKNIQAGNPFAKYGSKAPVATLSKGKYLEVHDLDSIVTIGTSRWHVDNKKIVGDIIIDSLNVDAQPIGDAPGRWMSPDPLSEEFPSWSPYNMCFNNPMRFTDPTGMAPEDLVNPPDDITVNSSGNVTNVVRKEGENRFFDQKGTQLSFNDPKDTDKHMTYGHFSVGDNIYKPIGNLMDMVVEAGTISPNVSESHKSGADFVRLGFKSWGSWDFPYVLQTKFNVSTDEMVKAGFEGGSRTYFRFGEHNTIYNIYDAGQFIWGRALGHSGFSLQSGLNGASFNERVFSFGTEGDTQADTQAISNGFNFQYYNQKVKGWDED